MKRKILISFLILIVVLSCAHTFWNWRSGVALRRVLDETQHLGIPTEFSDIVTVSVPKDQNAVPLLTTAFVLMAGGSIDFNDKEPKIEVLIEYGKNIYDGTPIPDLTPLLADPDVAMILDLLHRAAQRPVCDWELKYNEGFDLRVPHLSPHRDAVILLCLEAINEAKKGDGESAFSILEDAIHLANHLPSDGLLISYLMWVVEFSHIQKSVNQIVECLSPEQLSISTLLNLREQLAPLKVQFRDQLVRAFDSERICFGIWFARLLDGSLSRKDYRSSLGRHGEIVSLLPSPILGPILKRDYRFYIESMVNIREAAGMPVMNVLAIGPLPKELPRWAPFSRVAIPPLSHIQKNRGSAEVKLLLTDVGLSLEVYRLENGHYPDSLSALDTGSSIPNDPITGEALIYEANADGLILQAPEQAIVKGDLMWKIDRGEALGLSKK